MWKKPTLLIDQKKVQRNIEDMHRKTKESEVVFRPHFKTHQSAEVGELFRKQGIDKITVSSVSMAQYFAGHGWNDITIAFPVNLREIDKINELAEKIRLNLLVDSVFSARTLAEKLNYKTGIFIEIDNGYHRSGLLPEQTDEADKIAETCGKSDLLEFKGFLTHAGNTYDAKTPGEILSIMDKTARMMKKWKERYKDRFPDIINSYGDTPSCSLAKSLSDFDEVRPGNFVYFDLMQHQLNACAFDDIAVAVACPVVSVYPYRNELIIYGGAVHLSNEYLADDNGRKIYGYIVRLNENGWSDPIPGAYVSSPSQEHGIVRMETEELVRFKPGDVLGVLPVHSCLTANLLKQEYVFIQPR
jgi:D-serine deaminase-like pyridoxal phosphate-dependent protein